MVSVFLSRIMEKCCFVNDAIWYVNALINGLFKVDLQTGKVSYMGMAEEKEKYLKRAYSEILYYEDFLYMIPFNAEAIGVYNISTGKFGKIPVSEKMSEKFYEAVLLADKIYLLPYKAKNFYCLDPQTKSLTEINELKDIGVSVISSVSTEEEIWFAQDGGHILYRYQPQNKEVRQIELGEMMGHFSSVGKVGNKIITTSNDRALALSIDLITEDVTDFNFEEYSRVQGRRNYYIAEFQDKAVLTRIGSNDCIIINIQSGEITEKKFFPISLSLYGKIWESELGIAMLPTIRDKAFRFFDGRVINFNDEKALIDWGKRNNFQWIDYDSMPDYGIRILCQIVDLISSETLKKRKPCNINIFNTLKE